MPPSAADEVDPQTTSRQGSLLGRLLSESAIYGLGGISNQALAVILVPIYANVLGVSNYGILAVVSTTLSLATMVVTLALPQAFFRSYLKEAESEADREAVLRTALGLRLLASFAGLLLLLLLAVPLARLIFGDLQQITVIFLIGPIVFFDTLNLVPLSLLRGERRPGAYAALSFARALVGGVLIVILVVVARLGVLGVLVGSAIGAMVVASVGMVILARGHQLRIGLDGALARHMLAFSLPLVPASVAGWTLNLSDRYVIQAFRGHNAVGVYSAGYTIGLLINALAIAPFTLAWGAAYWEISRAPGAERQISRVMTAFAAFACLIALALSCLATDVLRLLFRPEYGPGRFVVPFSAFAYVCYGLYSIGATGLNLASKTRWLPVTLGISALANIALNLLLVPAIGYMGAAVSTLVCYALLAVLSGMISQRYYPVPWDLPRTIGAFLLALGLAAAALLGPDHVAWRVGCLIAYPALVVLLRIVSIQDVAVVVRSVLRQRASAENG